MEHAHIFAALASLIFGVATALTLASLADSAVRIWHHRQFIRREIAKMTRRP